MELSVRQQADLLKVALENVKNEIVISPEFDQKLNQIVSKSAAKKNVLTLMQEEHKAEIDALEKKYGVVERLATGAQITNETMYDNKRINLSIDGILIYEFYDKRQPPEMPKRTEELNDFLLKKDVKKALKLKSEILEAKTMNSSSFFAKQKLVSKEKKLQTLVQGENDYSKYLKYLKVIDKANQFFKEWKELSALHQEKEETYLSDSGIAELNKEYANVLNDKITKMVEIEKSIVRKKELLILNFYFRNDNILDYLSTGAKPFLKNEFGQDTSLQNFFREFESCIQKYNLAIIFHREWRKTRRKDGAIEPSWKVVKDKHFIATYQHSDPLPSVLRKNNGKLEIDIANIPFENLSLDWQEENYAAAGVCQDLVLHKYNLETAGAIIHKRWLKRNEWAKGGELDVPFEQLSDDQKQKHVLQFKIALDFIKGNPEKYLSR